MVSDNYKNELFNLIKYIILILIYISIGLIIATLHNRKIIFASDTGYSFGVIDVEGELVQGEGYNGTLKEAFYYNFYNVVSNYRILHNHSNISRSDFYDFLDSCLDAHSSNVFETFFESGFLPNVFISDNGILGIAWKKGFSTGALSFDINNNPIVKYSSYSSLLGSQLIFSDILYSSLNKSNLNRPGTYNISQLSTLYDSWVYVQLFGSYSSDISNFVDKYIPFSSSNPLIFSYDPTQSFSIYTFSSLMDSDFILVGYPIYLIYKNVTPFDDIYVSGLGYLGASYPNWTDSSQISVGLSLKTQYWFSEVSLPPVFPTPTPIPTALPTVTPTPLPLAFDSNIDGMEDGTTLGFLESLSDGFDALISTFTVIPFFSLSISYLYNYSSWFKLLFFVPIVAFLSFLIGRNKS